jgi:hypothetical protein
MKQHGFLIDLLSLSCVFFKALDMMFFSVIISVIGGSTGFEAKPALQEQIRKSLSDTCQSSDAWVITGTVFALLSSRSINMLSMQMDSVLAPRSLLVSRSNRGKKSVKYP